ncbi:MAG: pre-16S rRNA-processing nuclease YqgF [Acidimicrobiia bacterium]|nr:pre-16S rRNA-processing nuclease YqgF [Acidimicrobiia bacterium]
MTRVLGVDLGERRIGLAVSDSGGVLASPHSVLGRSGDPAGDHRNILEVAADLGAGRIVVGLPRSLSGRLGPAARGVLDEVDALRRAAGPSGPEVEVHDERFTTVIAHEARRAPAGPAPSGGRGRSGKVRRPGRRTGPPAPVDDAAAAVMLQSYLDARRGAGGPAAGDEVGG